MISPILWQPGMPIEAGIYLQMPENVYFGNRAMSVSGLKDFRKAPRKYRFGEKATTRPQSIGKLWHTALLQPEFLDDWYRPTEVSRRGTKAWDAEELAAAGRELIKMDDWDEMLEMRASVMNQGGPLVECLNHPDLLAEVSFFWWDNPAGVFCRGRADMMVLEHGICGDVKSCEDASVDFEKSIANYRYNWQSSFYQRGLRQLGVEIGDFVFFAIEKSKPYLHKPWYCHPDDLDHADRIISDLLMQYRKCLDTDEWPGYSQEIETIKLSEFALRKQ